MKYLCLIYHDEATLKELTECEDEALAAETYTFRDEMRESGHFLSANALESIETAASLRSRGSSFLVTDGPYVETKEQLGGYILIEARDLNEAIRVASRFPPARLGGIEVRPVRDTGME